MIGFIEELSKLSIGEEIGSGGQATVYRVLSPQWPETLFKKYENDVTVVSETIDALTAWRGGLNAAELETLDTSASWPRARVVDAGRTVGVLIPAAPDHFYVDVRGFRRLNELSYLVFGERSRKLGLTVPEPFVRAAVTANLVALMELFDRHKIVHGDISFKNLLWTSKPSPSCYVLDCDGVRMAELPPALPHVTTQHWTDPRLQAGTIRYPDLESDRLAIALVFYRSYFQARGDFTGGRIELPIPSEPALNAEVQTLLERALVGSAPRPSAAEWNVVDGVVAARSPEISPDSGQVGGFASAPRVTSDHLLEVANHRDSSYSTQVDLIGDASSASPSVAATNFSPTSANPPSQGAASSDKHGSTNRGSNGSVAAVPQVSAFSGGWVFTLLVLFAAAVAAGFFALRTFVG